MHQQVSLADLSIEQLDALDKFTQSVIEARQQ
jgi:hypothetical protein